MLTLGIGLAQEHPVRGRNSIDVGCLEAHPRMGGFVPSSGDDKSVACRTPILSIHLSHLLTNSMSMEDREASSALPQPVRWNVAPIRHEHLGTPGHFRKPRSDHEPRVHGRRPQPHLGRLGRGYPHLADAATEHLQRARQRLHPGPLR